MITKHRLLIDSRTKDRQQLTKLLTRIQYNTIELILNAEYKGCRIYDRKNGGLYKKGMIPCTLNDIKKAINKKVDKLFHKLSSINLIKKVVDLRGRTVWMFNPDLYWDYVGWELYYNRWLFELAEHRQASEVVNLSLYYGYYYHCQTNQPIKKIPRSHWQRMCKWWWLTGNDQGIELIDVNYYQPKQIIDED